MGIYESERKRDIRGSLIEKDGKAPKVTEKIKSLPVGIAVIRGFNNCARQDSVRQRWRASRSNIWADQLEGRSESLNPTEWFKAARLQGG